MGKFVLVFTGHQKKTFQKLAGASHGHTSKITANAILETNGTLEGFFSKERSNFFSKEHSIHTHTHTHKHILPKETSYFSLCI